MGSASLRSVLTGVVTFVVVSCLTWGLCEWMTVREPRRLQARAGPRGVGPPRPLRAATVTPVAPQATTPCLGMDPADAQLALADRVRGLRVVTTFDCLPLEVRAHLRGPGTEDVTVTAGAAIYRADGSLLCGAEWTRIPGDCAGWVRLRVTSPRPMHAGESYTVAVHIRDAMSCVACGEGDDGCSASPRSTGLSRWPARMAMQPDGHTYAITCAVEPIPEFTPSTS